MTQKVSLQLDKYFGKLESCYGLTLDKSLFLALGLLFTDVFMSIVGWGFGLYDINPLYSHSDIVVRSITIIFTHLVMAFFMIYIVIKIDFKWFAYTVYFTVAGVYLVFLIWNMIMICSRVTLWI